VSSVPLKEALETLERIRRAAGCTALLDEIQLARLLHAAVMAPKDWLFFYGDVMREQYRRLLPDEQQRESDRRVSADIINLRVAWSDHRGISVQFDCRWQDRVVASDLAWDVSPLLQSYNPSLALLIHLLQEESIGRRVGWLYIVEAVATWQAGWPDVDDETMERAASRVGVELHLADAWRTIHEHAAAGQPDSVWVAAVTNRLQQSTRR
jgi:hypothetical protein